MDNKIEQRANVKFYVNPGDTATMLRQAYGDEAMSRGQCFEWNKRFLSRKSSLKDKERPGRPSTINSQGNVDKVGEVIHQDRRWSIDGVV